MTNMDYCRFNNTLSDLQDCYRHINDPVERPSELCTQCDGDGEIMPRGVEVPGIYTCPACGGEPSEELGGCKLCGNSEVIGKGNSSWDEETARESIQDQFIECPRCKGMGEIVHEGLSEHEDEARKDLIELCMKIAEEVV